MDRNSVTLAFVLEVKDVGEGKRQVTLFTAETGLIEAVQYGGAKSKLRSLVTPYNKGRVWLYRDKAIDLSPVSGRNKIEDFEVISNYPSFITSLYKSMSAMLAVEVIIRTYALGDYEHIWALLDGFLSSLDECKEDVARALLLRFLWRYIVLMGIAFDTRVCGICGRRLEGYSYFTVIENGLVCPYCIGNVTLKVTKERVDRGVIKYLGTIVTAPIDKIGDIVANSRDIEGLKRLLFSVLKEAVDGRLRTLDMGIL